MPLPMPARNLVNLSAVGKDFAARTILDDVTLGIADGDRIGVVGANGEGKSTLLGLVAGAEQPDRGSLTRTRGVRVASLGQGDGFPAGATVATVLIGDRAEHEWAGERTFRQVLDGLLGGVGFSRFEQGAATRLESLSGGERRRIALAQALVDQPELLLLDEPTSALDPISTEYVEALLRQLAPALTLIVVTHNLAQARRVSQQTMFFYDGHLVEHGPTDELFARPREAQTERYVNGRIG